MRHRAERRLLHDPAAVPRDRLAGPQLAAEPQPFEHASDALFERHAAGDELGADVRHVAGDADAEDEAAFADLVQGRDAVRQHDRVAQRRQQHRGAELDALVRAATADSRVSGSCRGRASIESPTQIEIVAEQFGAFGQREQRRRLGAALHDPLAGRQQISDAHGHDPGLPLWLRPHDSITQRGRQGHRYRGVAVETGGVGQLPVISPISAGA